MSTGLILSFPSRSAPLARVPAGMPALPTCAISFHLTVLTIILVPAPIAHFPPGDVYGVPLWLLRVEAEGYTPAEVELGNARLGKDIENVSVTLESSTQGPPVTPERK